MSHNIGLVDMRAIRKLCIPLDALKAQNSQRYTLGDLDEAEYGTDERGRKTIIVPLVAEGGKLVGYPFDTHIEVTELTWCGEFSGSGWDILKAALGKSTGYFRAIVYWDEPGTITELLVRDGVVTETWVHIP